MLLVYHTILLTALIFLFPVVLPLVLSSKKRRRTVLQRLGLAGLPEKTNGCSQTPLEKGPLWVHALSVGETFASVELVERLRRDMPDAKIYFSVSTDTGYAEARKKLSSIADRLFFYPYDFLFSVRRVQRRICPSAFVLVESDIWPTFLFELQKMKVPAVLVNGRLSPASYRGYKRLSFLMKPVFETFSAICVQSEGQGERFRGIGISSGKIRVTGNMKFDHRVQELDDDSKLSLKKSLGVEGLRKVFLAGSTHPGEESIILDAFSSLSTRYPDLALVLVPRDHERADEVCRMAAQARLSVKKLSQGKPGRSDVVVVDVMGVLAKLYSVADVAFVGGSLAPFGGHNPLEPAAFAKPILFGPDMSDFPEISRLLLEAGGAVQVKDAGQVESAVFRFLYDPNYAETTGRNAMSVFSSNRGAVERTAAVVRQIAESLSEKDAKGH